MKGGNGVAGGQDERLLNCWYSVVMGTALCATPEFAMCEAEARVGRACRTLSTMRSSSIECAFRFTV